MTKSNSVADHQNPQAGAEPLSRRPYIEPKLVPLGDVASLTQAIGPNGNADNGLVAGRKSSGL